MDKITTHVAWVCKRRRVCSFYVYAKNGRVKDVYIARKNMYVPSTKYLGSFNKINVSEISKIFNVFYPVTNLA